MALAEKLQAEEAAGNADGGEGQAPQGTPITSYVKQDIVKQLEDMGFSKHASEKALFMTMSKG